MKRLVVVFAGSVALAAGVALVPMATGARATAQGAVLTAHWASRPVTIAAPRHVNLKAISNATAGHHPHLVPPFHYFSASRTAAARAAAVRSGGRRSGVRVLAGVQSASVTPTEDFPVMNLSTQVNAFGQADEGFQPPDTQVAAGPTDLVEVVNDSLSVWSKTGSLVEDKDLNPFFGVPSGFIFTDPRVLYDNQSGRWFISGWSVDENNDSQTYVATSQTSDPTGAWLVSTVQNNVGVITDQPMIGVCDDKVVMAWNEYSSSSAGLTYEGAQVLALQKAALEAGTEPATASFTTADEFRLVPAQSLSSTEICYMTVNNASSDIIGSTATPTLGVIALSGNPDATVTLTETDLPIATTTAPPDPRQPGGTTNDTQNDDRMLSAVWQDNVLWTSLTDACTPGGDSATRDCMRLDEVNTSGSAPSLTQDFDLAANGLDDYYPAVSLDSSGNLFVAYTASSPTLDPGAYAVVSPASSVASFTAPTTIQAGLASYNGGTDARWGDYSAAAPDPSVAGAVWVAGEYAPSDAASGDWGTATAELQLSAGYPGVTSADQATFTEGTAGSFTVAATGSPAPALTETGALPSGVTFSSSGVLSGTPAAGTGGSYPIQITASSTVGSVAQSFTLNVQPTGPLYTPLGPVRVLDTRNGTGGHSGPVGAGQAISLQITGVAGVPSSGVTAVVLNVTATSPTTSSFVTVYPDGTTRPVASNLNFTTGETIPNLVTVPVGADGKIDLYNQAGTVNLIADLAGYYSNSGGSSYVADGPVRVLDTRNGTGAPSGPVGPGQSVHLQVTGVAGVPDSGVTAVVLNVTATSPSTSSFVTVFPDGTTRPVASNLNFTAGETIPNLVVVPVGAFGTVDLYNQVGTVNLIADLAGYYTSNGGSSFTAAGPVRLLDTRNGTGGHSGPVGPGQAISLQVTGVAGVPSSGVKAVVLNVTATTPSASSFVTVYPDGATRPVASNLNFTPGKTIPNLVVVPVGADGKVDFYNSFGTVNLIADLAGYYLN